MEVCIVCDNQNDAKSVEHIVPESFGNKDYVMEKGKICDECNQRFSKFEDKALSNTIFTMERARLAIKTKKGKNVKGKIDDLTITGDANFRKQFVRVGGLNQNNLRNFDPNTKTGELIVKSFDKSETATSRFLLMLGIESLYTSQRKIFNQYDFQELKNYLLNKSNTDWGFITAKTEQGKFESIPSYNVKYNLKKKNIELRFLEKSNDVLLFKFRFGGISMIINLLGRGLDWVDDYKSSEKHAYIYPNHLEEKYKKSKGVK